MNLNELKESQQAPEWLTEEGYAVLSGGYLLNGETPKDMWLRVSDAAAKRLKKPDLGKKFFDMFWKNWLCGASPVLANMGTERALPISCYSQHIEDSVYGIFDKVKELSMLSKNGGGVGIYFGDVRGRGSAINGNGYSEGIIPWMKVFDTTTIAVSQGGVRRGSSAVYLPIEHLDINEFINLRRPTGDANRRCMNLNHAVCISDKWMNEMLQGDKEKRILYQELLKCRVETGEPYIMFMDNANKQRPECYVQNNLDIKTSNLCSEIFLHTDPDHTFVCCLSSLNLARYDEWKNTDTVKYAIYFLDGVMEEFIEKAKHMKGLESAVRFAEKSRALGLGVLGWHTLLQSKNLPFDCFDSMMLNAEIFKRINRECTIATKELALEYGEPEWCKGFCIRNSHLQALAPTVSNSIISGNVSAGIEPIAANIFVQKSAKGNFIKKNKYLEVLLKSIDKDTSEVWKSINEQKGSIQHLDFLNEEQKKIFLTAREINQHAIIKQAAQRQKYIDQGQSVNLFFASNADAKYIHEVHIAAWQEGLKSLYYLRSEGVLRGDLASRSKDECAACEA